MNDKLYLATIGNEREIRSGDFVATATVSSTRRNLFHMAPPGGERFIGTLQIVGGSKSDIAGFERDCARIVSALAAAEVSPPPPQPNEDGLTIGSAEVKALLYGVPKHEFSTALSRLASWLAEHDDETPTPPGNQIRTAECDGKDAVPVTGQLPVGTASPQSHLAPVEIPGELEMFEGKLTKVVDASRTGWWRFHAHRDRNGYCDNPARGY